MKFFLAFSFTALSICTAAQQVADTTFKPMIRKPSYKEGKGPLVLLDEGHTNFHTSTGRFRPFADFLRRDGYTLTGLKGTFTKASLSPAKILVIANALHPSNEEQWTLPTPSAFTDEEITAVNNWVKNGGSLFLIADHMPFPGCAERLAASFGFTFMNGFAMKKGKGAGKPDLFTPGHGLSDCVLTRGNNADEKITSLQTFTGQGFRLPSDAMPVVTLDSAFRMILTTEAWDFDNNAQVLPADGLAQGGFMKYGKGRVVVFGEAAMFSAQIQNGMTRMGMNAPTAQQNPQFLLNVIHWLDGKLN